jgi:hypothetical protein
MKRYVSIFPSRKQSLGTKIMLGSANILAEDLKTAISIAKRTVPEGWPFILVEYEYYDKVFHTAYDPDWSNPTDYGINENYRKAMEEAEHTENY